jgi:hypothetical protein
MKHSRPERGGRELPSSTELPYGPLPARSRDPRTSAPTPLDQLVDLSWLEPEATGAGPGPRLWSRAAGESETVKHDDSAPGRAEPESLREEYLEPSEEEGLEPPAEEGLEPPAEGGSQATAGLSLASPRPEADDDVHFGVAARALGVSRKTVERMVKRGQLDRGPSGAPATVSKRALVAVLEHRRRDVSHLARASEIEANSASEWPSADLSQDPASALRDLLVPVLAPLLDEFVAVRTRAAVLESQLESIRAHADRERARDELLLSLATRGWWGRRRTRKAVLRHYVLGEHDPRPGSQED